MECPSLRRRVTQHGEISVMISDKISHSDVSVYER